MHKLNNRLVSFCKNQNRFAVPQIALLIIPKSPKRLLDALFLGEKRKRKENINEKKKERWLDTYRNKEIIKSTFCS
jgi:hypothetical protein